MFRSNDWETIEKMLGTAPKRQICTQPAVSLRLKVAFFVTANSKNGCIEYGGLSGVFYQQVQARGQKGQKILVTQKMM